MKNKQYEEFAQKKFNKDNNYKMIMEKVKEGSTMKKCRTYKILNVVAMIIIIIMIGSLTPSIYAKIKWDIQFKEYQQNRQLGKAKGSLEEAKESGYAQVIDMDYVAQDGIYVKVDSILLTDDCFDANIRFKFDENVTLDSERFLFGYAIYDENKNIYQVFGRMHMDPNERYDKVTTFIYKELGFDYNKKDIYAPQFAESSNCGNIEADKESKTIVSNITLRARDRFPESKKIYIRLFDLGYTMFDSNASDQDKINTVEDFQMSKAEWIFEIDVPDKFQKRQTLELKLQEEIPDLKIEKITLTESSMVVKFKSQEYVDLIVAGKDMKGNEFAEARENALYITNGEGRSFLDLGGGTTPDGGYKMTLDAGKKELDKKLYIHFKSNGKQYTSELIVK